MSKENNSQRTTAPLYNSCKFCDSVSQNLRTTLYGVSICDKCHTLFEQHNVKMDLEDLNKSIEVLRNFVRKCVPVRVLTSGENFANAQHPLFEIVNIRPYSATEDALKQSCYYLRISSYIMPNFYRKLLNRKTKEIIERELKESRETQIEQYANIAVFKEYPKRYCEIIEMVKMENISLYEYYFGEYPPDWEYRAKIVKERDGNMCKKCGKTINLCVHHKKHIKPVKEINQYFYLKYHEGIPEEFLEKIELNQGGHFLDNLLTLCQDCHLGIHPSIAQKIQQTRVKRRSTTRKCTRKWGQSEFRMAESWGVRRECLKNRPSIAARCR